VDASRFDHLVRLYAGDRSRRSLVRGLTGVTLAWTTQPLLGIVSGKAKKKHKKKKCKGGTKKCGKKCIPKSGCCTDADCATGDVCLEHACTIWQGICEDGDNVCAQTGTLACNSPISSECYCTRSVTGELRCGHVISSLPCNCTTDAECQAELDDPGAFCMSNTGGFCGGLCGGGNICAGTCLS
jgi:hypothetical protein